LDDEAHREKNAERADVRRHFIILRDPETWEPKATCRACSHPVGRVVHLKTHLESCEAAIKQNAEREVSLSNFESSPESGPAKRVTCDTCHEEIPFVVNELWKHFEGCEPPKHKRSKKRPVFQWLKDKLYYFRIIF
jgi:hypothetical protein